MIDEDELLETSIVSLFGPLVILLVVVAFIFSILVSIDSNYRRHNQEILQNGVSRALTAYLTEYTTDTENLSNISEGYLLKEDIEIYNKNSNAISLDYNRATDYFFNILDCNVNLSSSYIKTFGVYIVEIGTEFNKSGKASYNVRVLRNGNDLMSFKNKISSLEDVESYIENTLKVKLDIATGYNNSVRTYQSYSKDEGKTGDGNTTYSSYSTAMAIMTNIPIRGVFGSIPQNVYELQTYSLIREVVE